MAARPNDRKAAFVQELQVLDSCSHFDLLERFRCSARLGSLEMRSAVTAAGRHECSIAAAGNIAELTAIAFGNLAAGRGNPAWPHHLEAALAQQLELLGGVRSDDARRLHVRLC